MIFVLFTFCACLVSQSLYDVSGVVISCGNVLTVYRWEILQHSSSRKVALLGFLRHGICDGIMHMHSIQGHRARNAKKQSIQ